MVASEMLSGPDLGGGFLHQLTIDRADGRRSFTFHAQDGGADAGGPPPGSPEPFGYARTAEICPFGGPRCWHRRFTALGETDAGRVRVAYNRMRFVMATMLGQVYGSSPPAIAEALREIRARLEAPGRAPVAGWYVGGSTAAWILGARLLPRDIDLAVAPGGAAAVSEALNEYLIEPLADTDWPGRGPIRAARAFVGTVKAGARVEWGEAPDDDEEWSGEAGRVRTLTVPWESRPIVVTRPEYALARAWERGRSERVEPLVRLVRERGVDAELLARLLERSARPVAETESLLRRCARDP